MALTTTTLTSACGQTDTVIVVSSATGCTAGCYALVDQELMQVTKTYSSGTTIPVIRGLDGSAQVAHKGGAGIIGANVTFFLGSDESPAATPQSVTTFNSNVFRRKISFSTTATVGINTGEDLHVTLSGTTAIPLTVTAPTKEQDGQMLIIVGNGKAAHTVTVTGGVGAAGTAFDVATFQAGAQQALAFTASNGAWCLLSSPNLGTQTTNSVTWA